MIPTVSVCFMTSKLSRKLFCLDFPYLLDDLDGFDWHDVDGLIIASKHDRR